MCYSFWSLHTFAALATMYVKYNSVPIYILVALVVIFYNTPAPPEAPLNNKEFDSATIWSYSGHHRSAWSKSMFSMEDLLSITPTSFGTLAVCVGVLVCALRQPSQQARQGWIIWKYFWWKISPHLDYYTLNSRLLFNNTILCT